MSQVFLNGEYLPMEEAKISPMDRGFLFGEGIYEVIPSYSGKLVGFTPHIHRMIDGLQAIDITLDYSHQQWRDIAATLIEKNGGDNLGIYFHVSRGADSKRSHIYSDNMSATVFAYAFEIPPEPSANRNNVKPYTVSTAQDLRWKRCHIKSTALLGNVMHLQEGHKKGNGETILYNERGEITEGCAVNVFIVKNGRVITPLLDGQILPGITRLLLLDILRQDGTILVEERVVTLTELREADEVWITSSSKEIAPVIAVDGKAVGDGKVGEVWEKAQALFTQNKYDYIK